eukprot:6192529-Pleurochrysis_carterae.AAC.2
MSVPASQSSEPERRLWESCAPISGRENACVHERNQVCGRMCVRVRRVLLTYNWIATSHKCPQSMQTC